MRERDLRVLEFHKVIDLVAALAASEPGRRAVRALRPRAIPTEVAKRLRARAEMVSLRSHAGALPMQEFADQRKRTARRRARGRGARRRSAAERCATSSSPRATSRLSCARASSRLRIWRRLPEPGRAQGIGRRAARRAGRRWQPARRREPGAARLRNRLRAERVELETRLARSLSASGMEPFVSDYLVTVRNHRFVLPLKLNYSERLEGIVQDRSVSGETLFVEPMWAVELNNRLLMLEREVEAEEHRILAYLTAMIRGYGAELG